MIRRVRMTIAALSKRIDSRFRRAERRTAARFDAVDARFDAVDARFARMERQLESLGDKLDRIAGNLDEKFRHQQKTLGEHENRLRDLEANAHA
jgi:chromosome segregation ATPase